MIRSLLSDVKLEEELTLCYDRAMTEPSKPILRALSIFLIFILYTAIILIVAFPNVRQAVRESGVLEMITAPKTEVQRSSTLRSVRVVFSPKGTSFVPYTVEQQRLGSSLAHDTFEALLGGVPLQGLEEGAVTFISKNTKLLGLTLASNILYLDLSKEFLNSPNLKLAYRQIVETAEGLGAKDVVLLIEGAQVDLEAVQ